MLIGGLLVSAAMVLVAQNRRLSEEAIRRAQKIGEVKAFNADFGFIVTNAGTYRRVNSGMRLGVRRKGKLVIIAIVETTTGYTSTCGLIGYIPPTEPKTNAPKVGDEIIFYPPRR